ncbi:MAG: IS110 family transposase [Gemmatimonadales bacterium]|jgi:transposase
MRKLTVGLDVGDKYSWFCLLDHDGAKIEEGRVRTTPRGIGRKFEDVGRMLVVLEVGTHSPWVSRLLEGCGHEVLVANSRRLQMIYGNDQKTDAVDAELLARVGRMDPKLLYPVRHRGAGAQADLGVIRSRDALVQARVQLVNHVRGSVKAFGGRLPSCSTPAFAQKAGGHIPEELVSTLGPVLETIARLTSQIRAYDRKIVQMCRERYPETRSLSQVNGVGDLTALCYVLTLDDPRRFHRSRSVGPYLGLTRRRRESGERQPQLGISKAGDEMLRRLLVGSAHYILGPFGSDSDLRRWGQQLASRGGKTGKKRAVVAVARRLAVLLHSLWLSGEVYEPLRQARLDEAA